MKTSVDVINAVQKAIASLSGLIFLLLIISQFLAYFNYTNMAPLAAISLANILQQANLDAVWLLIGFVIVVLILDLIITGAIPKWAIFAPIFVPLLMKLGVAPDAVLAAYRVGDSPMNSITPLNAYFAMIVVFCQQVREGRRRRHGDRADAALRDRDRVDLAVPAGRLAAARTALGHLTQFESRRRARPRRARRFPFPFQSSGALPWKSRSQTPRRPR